MNNIKDNIVAKYLLRIKHIIDEDNNYDRFVIVRRQKNINFMRENNISNKDVKSIIRTLSIEDCIGGPDLDRNNEYEGWIFKFKKEYKELLIYIKLRVETQNDRTICISIHEFGLYDNKED